MKGSENALPSANGRRFAIDSRVLIPIVATWHENHERSIRAVDVRMRAGWKPIIPANVLLETFAVLTRLPAPFRVKPEIAREALAATLPGSGMEVSPLDCLQAMQNVDRASLAGGKVYDAAIAECAVRCGASLMLTFDASDYSRVRPPAFEIAVPE
jgi:predicted nucleic acid-binding protein